jgi:hypothetical protein
MWKMTSMAYFCGIYRRMALQLKQNIMKDSLNAVASDSTLTSSIR